MNPPVHFAGLPFLTVPRFALSSRSESHPLNRSNVTALSAVRRIYLRLIVLLARSLALAHRKNLEDSLSWDSDCLYACGFRIYFTPLPGFFSPFPHGTGALSVDHEYLALEDGPPIFGQDYTCPALLVVPLVPLPTFHVRGCHPLRLPFPEHSITSKAKRYRLLPFRSPLLWESRLISVPAGTEMFQFSAFAPAAL